MDTRFGHQIFAACMVHPERKEVFPLCPEPVYKEDGLDKNDCELNAFKRFIADFKREHPKLKNLGMTRQVVTTEQYGEIIIKTKKNPTAISTIIV